MRLPCVDFFKTNQSVGLEQHAGAARQSRCVIVGASLSGC